LNAAIGAGLLALVAIVGAACTSQSTTNGSWSFGPSLAPSSASPGAPTTTSAPASAAPAASPS
jgi:hypothetical protein